MEEDMNPADPKVAVADASRRDIDVQRAAGRQSGSAPWLIRILKVRESFLVAILLILIIVMSIIDPGFRSGANLRAVLLGFAMEGMVVIGMTMLLVSGGFDLSVGANMAFSGMVTAQFLLFGWPVPLAMAAGCAVGIVVGLLNAWIVAKVGVNALIATLGTMTIVRGIALTVWAGQPVLNLPESFRSIGQGVWLGIPVPAVILIVLTIIFDILMRRGRWFRQLYFVGGSEKAARLSGINVTRVRIITYVAAGLLAALGGVISTSRLGAGYPNSYEPTALRVISGAVIGGCSLFGGEGSVVGSVMGLFFINLLLDIMVLRGVSPYAQGIVQGVALILAVVVDIWTKRQAARG
jgi:ribose transport system permease protein